MWPVPPPGLGTMEFGSGLFRRLDHGFGFGCARREPLREAFFEKSFHGTPPGRHEFGQRFFFEAVAARIIENFEQFGLPRSAPGEILDVGGGAGIRRRDALDRRVQWLALAQ